MNKIKLKLLSKPNVSQDEKRDITLIMKDGAINVALMVVSSFLVMSLLESSESCCKLCLQLPDFTIKQATKLVELLATGETTVAGVKEMNAIRQLQGTLRCRAITVSTKDSRKQTMCMICLRYVLSCNHNTVNIHHFYININVISIIL